MVFVGVNESKGTFYQNQEEMREKFSAPSYQTKYLFAMYLYKSAKYDENVLAQNYALDTNLPN